MTTEISKERIEKVKELLKKAGYTDERIAELEKNIRELAEQYPVAADNFAYWLEGKGGTKYLKPAWLRQWPKVMAAEERIRGYYEDTTFPKKTLELQKEGSLEPGVRSEIKDHWDGNIVPWDKAHRHLLYASYRSSIRSEGKFTVEVTKYEEEEKKISLTGRVDHGWWDTYHWTKGKGFPLPLMGRVLDEQMEKLKEVGAKDYRLESWWSQSVTATMYMNRHGQLYRSSTRVQWGKVQYNPDGRKLGKLAGDGEKTK